MKKELSKAAKQAKNEYNKRYRQKMTPEQRQRAAQTKKAWRLRNPEKVRQHMIDFWERLVARDIKHLVMDCHKQGLSLREIGKRFSISHMTVKRLLQE